jgi:hypothetical protein
MARQSNQNAPNHPQQQLQQTQSRPSSPLDEGTTNFPIPPRFDVGDAAIYQHFDGETGLADPVNIIARAFHQDFTGSRWIYQLLGPLGQYGGLDGWRHDCMLEPNPSGTRLSHPPYDQDHRYILTGTNSHQPSYAMSTSDLPDPHCAIGDNVTWLDPQSQQRRKGIICAVRWSVHGTFQYQIRVNDWVTQFQRQDSEWFEEAELAAHTAGQEANWQFSGGFQRT